MAGELTAAGAAVPEMDLPPPPALGGWPRARRFQVLEEQRTFRPHIYWYLTFCCNLACQHCAVASSPWVSTSEDLATAECLEVVDQMAELGVGAAILTGGEALLRRDAVTIIRALAARGIQVGLESNGLRFDRPFLELARELQHRRMGRRPGRLLQITVSLDGGTAETHERLRGPRTFARTVSGLRRLKEHGISFQVQCVLNRDSAATIPELYELAAELYPELRLLQFAFLNPVGRGVELVERLGLRPPDFHRIFELIRRHKETFPHPTLIKGPPALVPPRYLAMVYKDPGISKSVSCQFPLLGVLPNGDVTVCAVSRESSDLYFGNIRNVRLAEIWQKTRMSSLRCRYKSAEHLRGICGDCIWKSSCKGGCRAWAYQDGGDFDAPLPICRALDERGEFPRIYRLSSHQEAIRRHLRDTRTRTPEKATPALAPRYQGFVDPGHPLLRELFPAPEGDRDGVLAAAIAALRQRSRVCSVPGRQSFDELLGRWQKSGEETLDLNCINLSCLLTSHLRRAGFSADQVFVLLGGVRSFAHVHAWVLLRDGRRLRRIDPADLEIVETDGRWLIDHYNIYTIFNDQCLHALEADKRRLLLDPAERSAA